MSIFILLLIIVIITIIFNIYNKKRKLKQHDINIKHHADMYIAREIQRGILPKKVKTPELNIQAYMKPADMIGGDYYDIRHFNGVTWITIGDVTGHGTSAGLVMVMVQSIISSILYTSSLLSKIEITPAEVNYIANYTLLDNLKRLDKTDVMTIITICIKEDKMLVSGSHDNFYIFRYHHNTIEIISPEDFVLGLGFEKLNLEDISQTLYTIEPNDTIFIVTDGVIEAAKDGDYNNGMYGEDRFLKFIKENIDKKVGTIKYNLIKEIEDFTNNKNLDDTCFIIIRKGEQNV